MSDYEKLVTRLATLEAEVSGYRAQAKAPAAGFSKEQIRQAMTQNPTAFMASMGIPVDHVSKVLVAHAMGDQAPAELKMLASFGPQLSATQALQAQVEELSGKLASIDASRNKQGTRQSFQALAKDKTKYPHLATALAGDPDLFDEELESHGGSAEDLASKLEARHARIAKAHGITPPASNDAGTPNASQKTEPDVATKVTAGNPPPLFGQAQTPSDRDKALRDEILKKHAPAEL